MVSWEPISRSLTMDLRVIVVIRAAGVLGEMDVHENVRVTISSHTNSQPISLVKGVSTAL